MLASQPASRAARTGAFLTCTAIWSSTFLFIRIGNDTVPPLWAATLRLALAAAILGALLAFRRQRYPRGRALTAALQYGLLQFGGSFPLLYWGETSVPSGLSAVLYATVPLTIALLARAFGLERLQTAKVAGAITALAGVAIIFSSERAQHVPLLALAAVFLSTVSACFGSVLLKRGPAQSAFGVNAVGTLLGAGVCFLLSCLAGERHLLPATSAAVIPILYLTLAGSLIAFVLWAWLLHHAPISKISYIAVLVPLAALGLGALVRHERLPPLALAGSVVVLAGVGLGLGASGARTSH